MKHLFTFSILLLVFMNLRAQNLSEVEFSTKDGIKISASYQYPTIQKLSPALILIHQGGSSRQEWLGLPMVNQLIDKGYAILIYDIRQHGKSEKDVGSLNDLFNNPKRAPLDLLAAINFLTQDKRIDSNRIGIIGASIGANLACVASSSDKFNIKSIVSISAKTDAVKNLSGTEDFKYPINAFHIASEDEQQGMRAKWANELYSKTTGHKKVEIVSGNKHGSYILREHPALQNSIIEWFEKTL